MQHAGTKHDSKTTPDFSRYNTTRKTGRISIENLRPQNCVGSDENGGQIFGENPGRFSERFSGQDSHEFSLRFRPMSLSLCMVRVYYDTCVRFIAYVRYDVQKVNEFVGRDMWQHKSRPGVDDVKSYVYVYVMCCHSGCRTIGGTRLNVPRSCPNSIREKLTA